VSFTTEKLETYNWNYLDHYICTRGHTDFALVEVSGFSEKFNFLLSFLRTYLYYFCFKALKYWRFRVFLLPLHNSATRKILEGSPRCDIYTPPSNAEQASLMDGFLRFIEGWLNKIRRPNPNKNWVILLLLIFDKCIEMKLMNSELLIILHSENFNCIII